MKNIAIYKERMAYTMTRQEKLFFLDEVNLQNYDYIIDFGGANGRLIFEVQRNVDFADTTKFFIVDKNPEMESEYPLKNCQYVRSLDELQQHKLYGRVAIIFSSVLHECSDSDVDEIANFCQEKCNLVIARDMFFECEDKESFEQYENTPVLNKIRSNPIWQRMFEDIKAKGKSAKETIYEFFLKYEYVENWVTEVCEDYFSNGIEKLKNKLNGWKTLVDFNYILPYKLQKVKEDFGVNLTNTTHKELILKKDSLKYYLEVNDD